MQLLKPSFNERNGGNGKRKTNANISIDAPTRDAVIVEVDVHAVLKSKCNRTHNEKWSTEIARNWNWNLYQLITVNNRDGYDHVIDGQHRLEAAKKAGIARIPAWRINVPAEKEKDVFLDLTRKRNNVSPVDKYNILLAYGDPDTVKLHRIFTKYNLKVVKAIGKTAGHICLGYIYDMLNYTTEIGGRNEFFTILEETLHILTSAWPAIPEATSKPLVKTLRYFIARTMRHPKYCRDRFIKHLSKCNPMVLLSQIPQMDPEPRFITTYLSIHNNSLKVENRITLESLSESGKR